MLLSVVPPDGVPAIPALEDLAAAYARHGLDLAEARAVTPDELAASHSSWAKPPASGAARLVTLLWLRARS